MIDSIYTGYFFGVGLFMAGFVAYCFISVSLKSEKGSGSSELIYALSELKNGRGFAQYGRICIFMLVAISTAIMLYMNITGS